MSINELLTADVQPLGLLELHRRRVKASGGWPPFDGIPTDLVEPLPDWDGGLQHPSASALRVCDREFTEAARKVLCRTMADLRNKRDPHSPRWRDGLPLFVCGGGASSRIVTQATELANSTAKRAWDPYAGLQVWSLPVPRAVASRGVADDTQFTRLSVAYGLSFPAINIGVVEPPSAIEDIREEQPRSEWQSRYVGKDQV